MDFTTKAYVEGSGYHRDYVLILNAEFIELVERTRPEYAQEFSEFVRKCRDDPKYWGGCSFGAICLTVHGHDGSVSLSIRGPVRQNIDVPRDILDKLVTVLGPLFSK